MNVRRLCALRFFLCQPPRLKLLRLSGNGFSDPRARAATETDEGCVAALHRLFDEDDGRARDVP